MEKHLQQFIIRAFKGIHGLKLDNLNCINLLTGDNNSGKTSVLELLSTVDNPQNTGAWVLCSRMDNYRVGKRLYFNGFYNMFSIDDDTKIIAYDFLDKDRVKNTVELTAEFEETQLLEREMYRLNGFLRTGSTKNEDEIIDTRCMHLSTFINGEKVNEDIIFDFQTKVSKFVSKTPHFVRTNYVSPVSHANGTLNLDHILSDSKLYDEMLNILKAFDENITNINAIKSESNPYSTEYMVLTKDHVKALPLTAYGDGMKKAVLLLSSIVEARNGILLLDEFETAIHTSAMNSIFSWLLKSALELNVQVFLTSHSKEAIEKVLQCSKELQPYINLYTLYNYEGKNYVRMMDCQEAINAKDNLGLELR